MFLVALGVLPPAPLPGIATVGLVSKQNIKGDENLEVKQQRMHFELTEFSIQMYFSIMPQNGKFHECFSSL